MRIIKTEISYQNIKIKTPYHPFIRDVVQLSFDHLFRRGYIKMRNFGIKASVSVLICDDKKMIQLNKRYRNNALPTNELSFSYMDDPASTVIGEIVINWDELLRDSSGSFEDKKLSLLNFISHAILHIIGFTHENDEKASCMDEVKENIYSYVMKKQRKK